MTPLGHALMVCLFVAGSGTTGHAADGSDPPRLAPVLVSPTGIELWCAFLHAQGLQVSTTPFRKDNAREGILIHLGHDLRYLEQDDPRRQELIETWAGDGAILIATDGDLELAELGLQFIAGPVYGHDITFLHRSRSLCIYLVPQETNQFLGWGQLPWGQRRRVACNVSGYLLWHQNSPWRRLASFPPGCTVHQRP
ncbi:MAG: hypothetical protein NZ703_11610, partial [Gemmataceae bacterium]|nr:hypothetical protein [Gemmataceae bacterium]